MDEIKIKSDEGNIEIKDGKNVEIRGEENTIKVEGSGKRVKVFGKENKIKVKEGFTLAGNFLKQKRTLTWIFVILLIAIILFGCWLRVQNFSLLKDSTTDGYIPLALDPYYFLRIAETAIESGGFGNLPAFDSMRYPSLNLDFTKEFTPKAVVLLYQLINIFDNDVSLRFVDVISPVIFFALAMLVFFFLILKLTKSKSTALISGFFLAIIPSYLYRTMAGFADHESIGMFAFFLAMLGYVLILNFFEKNKNIKKIITPILFGVVLGFLSGFTNVAWGGISKYLYMIIPASFFLFWIFKTKNSKNIKERYLFNLLIFYLAWIVFCILSTMFFGQGFSSLLGKVLLSGSSAINGFVLLFLIIDFLMIKFKDKIHFISEMKKEKYRVLFSIGGAVILGGIFLLLRGGGFLSSIIHSMLNPFGGGRIGSTVAENKASYLSDWFGQMGKSFFWIFFAGMIFVGVEISKGIKKKKNKMGFVLLWALMICGILFSRISSSSMFDGDNFISKIFYLGTFVLFIVYCGIIYFKEDEIKIKSGLLVIASWLIFMLISGRGAIRLFFLMMPFVVFMGSFCVVKIFEYARKSKEDLLKLLFWVAFILVVILLIINAVNFEKNTLAQARSQSPSANYQWQNAMSWIRNNTAENSIFVHWWDYGYWVQTLGERATVTDGGHGNDFWDHLIGRYVLTTPFPETALSFMKAHNVSYLLMDPTDIGKYSAYSSIGSDEEGTDRISYIPTFISDNSQMQETSDSVMRVYSGGIYLDDDLNYQENNTEIFLPQGRAAIGAVILQIFNSGEISQPTGYYVYNNNAYYLPIRYIYINEQMIDFGNGVDATVYVYPHVYYSSSNVQQMDEFGAMMYLTKRTKDSLVAKLYLMDDPKNEYPGLELVYEDALYSTGFYYSGSYYGPIKIWKVNEEKMTDIIARDEFLRTSGEYAEFDNLDFVK